MLSNKHLHFPPTRTPICSIYKSLINEKTSHLQGFFTSLKDGLNTNRINLLL